MAGVSNNLKTAGLLGLLGGLFVLVGSVLNGSQGAAIALVIAVLFNFAMYFFSDRLALASARAKRIEPGTLPEVERMVASLAAREELPMPKLYLIEQPQPNAFATGRNPQHAAVAVTRGILELMRPEELEGVLAHELAHVKNRDILISTIAATVGAALSFLTRMAMFGGMGRDRESNNPLSAILGLVALIVAPLAAMLIQVAISRSREFQADRSGAEITGAPLALASALGKLDAGTSRVPMAVNPAVSQLFIADPLKAFGGRRGGGIARMFATHPPIAERVARLQQMASGVR
ncbi:MAG: zinc metalloprotease HtpX [Acidimicrobiia bacterium]|nr:zinc metalloprotease HtpX [Acidimicrobiia bacterium]